LKSSLLLSQSSLVSSRKLSWGSLLLLLSRGKLLLLLLLRGKLLLLLRQELLLLLTRCKLLLLLLLLRLELLLLLLRLELLLLLRYNSIFPVKLLLNGNGKHLRVEAEELLDGEPLNLRWI